MTPGPLTDMAEGLARIAAALPDLLPGGVSVARAGGAFDEGEIRRHVVNAPAAVVACLGLSDLTRHGAAGAIRADAQLALYLITRDSGREPGRDMEALALASRVLAVLPRQVWDSPEGFSVPEDGDLAATNLYSGAVDAVGVALWAVTWRQRVTLAPAEI